MNETQDFVKVREVRDALVLEIDATALNDFEIVNRVADEIEEAMQRSDLTRVVIDLQHVEMLNSIGLVVFVRTLKYATETGRCIVLCSVNHVVTRVLRISRLAFKDEVGPSHMSIADDVETAVSALESA